MEDRDKRSNSNTADMKFRIEHWMQVSAFLVAYDVCAVTLAYFMALLIRFDFRMSMIPIVYLRPWEYFAPIYALICIAVFWRCRLYKSIWRFASFTELERITLATIVTSVIHIIGITITINIVAADTSYSMNRMPVSYYIMGMMLQFILVTAIRFSYRFILLLRAAKNKKSASNIMLIGVHSIIGTT